jgi:hypothetical protein
MIILVIGLFLPMSGYDSSLPSSETHSDDEEIERETNINIVEDILSEVFTYSQESLITECALSKIKTEGQFRELVPSVVDYGSAENFFKILFSLSPHYNRNIIAFQFFEQILDIYDFDPNSEFFSKQFKIISKNQTGIIAGRFFRTCINKGYVVEKGDAPFLHSIFYGIKSNDEAVKLYSWLRTSAPNLEPIQIFKPLMSWGNFEAGVIFDKFKDAGHLDEILQYNEVVDIMLKTTNLHSKTINSLIKYYPADTIMRSYIEFLKFSDTYKIFNIFAKNNLDLTGYFCD